MTVIHRNKLFHPDHLVMGLMISILSWGALQLIGVREAQAAFQQQQASHDNTTHKVDRLIPVITQLDNKVDGVLCMLSIPADRTTLRLDCLQDVLNKELKH